jgi:hypothetical protein
VQRWSENVVWQFFSGMEYYEPRLPCDATQIGASARHRRRRPGAVAEVHDRDGRRDQGRQARRARTRDRGHHGAGEGHCAPGGQPAAGDRAPQGGQAAKRAGIVLEADLRKEGKELRRKAGGYAHAKQFKRLRKTVKRQRTILGVVMREVQRKLDAQTQAVAAGGRPEREPSGPTALGELKMWLRARRAHPHPAASRQEQAVRAACPRGRVHRQRQGAQALRIRRQGQPGRHAQAGV